MIDLAVHRMAAAGWVAGVLVVAGGTDCQDLVQKDREVVDDSYEHQEG
jgi:hypothetical protein